MLRQIPFIAILSMGSVATAQNMTSGEYWLDTDPGFGMATPLDFTDNANVVGASFTLPASGIAVGMHVIGYRARTVNGQWSHTNVAPVLVVAEPTVENIIRTEYFFNTDPGIGAATNANADGSPNVADASLSPSLTGLEPGINLLFTRSQDAQGRWSHTNAKSFTLVQSPALPSIVKTEYFLNTDPGFGAGTDAGIGGSSDENDASMTASLAGANQGINTLFTRSMDANGKWSLTNSVPILVGDNSSGDIAQVGYYWDTDPGFGMGLTYPASAITSDLIGEVDHVLVPDSFQNNSYHHLYMRSMDTRGRWSHTNHSLTGDSIWVDVSSSVAGLGNAFGISVHPNPFTEGIIVHTDDGQPVRVILYDPQGKLIYDQVLRNETHIDLQHYASGSYTAFFWKELKRIHRVQLVKQ